MVLWIPTTCFVLQVLVESSAQRVIQLAAQWEKHRVPLIQEFRELKALHDSKEVTQAKGCEGNPSSEERLGGGDDADLLMILTLSSPFSWNHHSACWRSESCTSGSGWPLMRLSARMTSTNNWLVMCLTGLLQLDPCKNIVCHT